MNALSAWLERFHLQAPAAIFIDAFRPLGWFAGEILAAAAPLLPLKQDRVERWSQQLGGDEGRDRSREMPEEGR